MKLGIIGLSRSGKTTIFEALTCVTSDNQARTETKIGTIPVPDGRVDILSDMYQPKKTIYAQVEYCLPGKSSQKKDQAIWTQVRDCDALIQVVGNFKEYGAENPTPYNDFMELNQDLIFADLVVVEKRLERLALDKRRGKKIDPTEISLLERCLKTLEKEVPLRHDPELATAHQLKGYAFVSAKPILILFNNDDDDDQIPQIKDLQNTENCMVIRAKIEQELSQMSEEDAQSFLEEFNISASAMDRVIKHSYEILGLMSFFTVGSDEVRAWTIKKDTSAVDAAEVIHSDIKKGFIRAEVLSYEDLMTAKTYQEAKKRGTVRLEGKTYIVKNGDIINFRFNV